MATLEAALSKYPPSIPSRCSSRKTCETPCPPCPNIRPPATGTSAVHFQIAHTCDSAIFSPCYYPRPIPCPRPERPPQNVPCSEMRLFDSGGRPICLYYR